jgi:hypothetical protein
MNEALGTAGTQLSHLRRRTLVMTRYWALNKHAISWLTLSNPRLLARSEPLVSRCLVGR